MSDATTQLKEFPTEDRAVSPVMGVVLMVAITVVLAAVIGTFVSSPSDQVSNSTPRAQFAFELANDDTEVRITHGSGDAVPAEELNATPSTDLVVDGTAYPTRSFNSLNDTSTSGSDMTAGDNVVVYRGGGNTWSGETVRVVWSVPDSSDTTTLARREF